MDRVIFFFCQANQSKYGFCLIYVRSEEHITITPLDTSIYSHFLTTIFEKLFTTLANPTGYTVDIFLSYADQLRTQHFKCMRNGMKT